MPLKLRSTVLKACLGVMLGANLVSAREIHVATTGDDAAPGDGARPQHHHLADELRRAAG